MKTTMRRLSSIRKPAFGFALGLLSLSATSLSQADVIFEETFDNGLGQFSESGYVSTGSYGARMRGGTYDGSIVSGSIDASGYTDLVLSFDRVPDGLDWGERGTAYVSINGGSYTAVDSVRYTSGRVSIPLGAEADGSSIVLAYAIDASSYYETYDVDNIVLEGTPTDGGGGDGSGGDGSGGDDGGDTGGNTNNLDPNASPSCTNLLPGQFDCTVDGRDVNIYVPSSVNGSVAAPLVVDMHGYTSSNSTQQSISDWDDLATTEGFVVAYPQGVDNSWNAQGQCCGSSTADDVQFIRNVVAHVINEGFIDTGRIYATGLSNGGSMTHTLACEAADLFAGASAVSFGISGGSSMSSIVSNCQSTLSQGIPVIHFHGTSDSVVSYESGVLDSLGAEDSLEAWRQVQSCSTSSTTQQLSSNTSCQIHSGCIDDVSVSMCTVTGGNHNLYPDVNGAGIPQFSWDFFKNN
jgi:poly(hydroxyalkanoate) depolymerase family esterase